MHASLHIPLEPIGKLNALAGVIGAVLIFPLRMLSDKKHPIRVLLFSIVGLTILTPIQFIFLSRNFTPDLVFHIMG